MNPLMLLMMGNRNAAAVRAWEDNTSISAGTWGSADSINSIASNGSIFVAVGADSQVATSTDGATWVYQGGLVSVWSATLDAQCVIWNGSMFIVVGDAGRVATSTDGVTWVDRDHLRLTSGWGSTEPVNVVVWMGTQFIVAGGASKCAISTDGITWTTNTGISTEFGTSHDVLCMVWNGSKLVCGAGNSNGGRVATSTNGTTWTYQTSLTLGTWGGQSDKHVNGLVWNGAFFLAVGGATAAQCATSADGVTWVFRSGLASAIGSAGVNAVVWAENKFIAVGDAGKLATSVDGVTWINNTGLTGSAYGATESRCIHYGLGSFIVGGLTGKLATYLTNGGDPYIADNVLKMQMDGANNSTVFSEFRGNVVTRVGSPVISTNRSINGGSSFYNASGSNYLTIPNTASFAFGSGDFTLSMWVYVIAIVDSTSLLEVEGQNTSNLGWLLDINASEKFKFSSWSTTFLTGTTTVVTGVWYHVAVTRQSGTMRLWVNGIMEASTTTAGTFTSTANTMKVGWGRNSIPLRGNIDMLQIDRVCRYHDTFIPPTSMPEY